MRAEIAIIVPSRGRPERLREMHASWEKFSEGRSNITVVVDEDQYETYPSLDGVLYRVVPRASFADKLRDTVGWVGTEYTAIASWNDDHVARTHWETAQLEALEEMGGGIVYGDDLVRHDFLPTAPTISVSIIKALGWIAPPGLRHMFIDDFWKALGIELGRLRYQPEVVIEHAHADVGRSERDATYDLSAATYDQDMIEWDRYQREDFAGDLERVKEALGVVDPRPV